MISLGFGWYDLNINLHVLMKIMQKKQVKIGKYSTHGSLMKNQLNAKSFSRKIITPC
jgi:hypothetical protein